MWSLNVLLFEVSNSQEHTAYVLVVLTKTLQAAKANVNPEYVSVPVRMKRCPFQVGRGLTCKGFSIDFCFWKFKHPAVAVANSTLGKGNLCCWDYEKPSSLPPWPLYSSPYCARNIDVCKCMGRSDTYINSLALLTERYRIITPQQQWAYLIPALGF